MQHRQVRKRFIQIKIGSCSIIVSSVKIDPTHRKLNAINFGVDKDDFLVGHLPYAATEVIKVGKQFYIVALKPGLDGMIVAKLKFVAKP